MFRNRSIFVRLALCFSLLLALLVVCAAVGVIGLNMVFSTASRAVENDVQLAQRAANIERLVLNERRYEKDSFINLSDPGKLASYETKWEDTRAALAHELATARSLNLAPEDRRAIDQIEASFLAYTDGFKTTVERIRSAQIRTTQEANHEFERYKDAVHGIESVSRDLNSRAIGRVNGVSNTLTATRSRSAALQIGIALFCVLLGVVLCVGTARSITRPLDRARAVADAIAGGKLDNPIETGRNDETGKLLAALRTMQASLLENELNAKGQITSIDKALAVAEFDLDGTVRRVNANFVRLLGYAAAEIEGRPHAILLGSAEHTAGPDRGFWDSLRRGEFASGQYRRIAKGGREVFVQASYNPILDLKGVPYKIVAYASDVTEQVRMKAALDVAVAETQAVIQAAIDGELTKRIATLGKEGQIQALAVSVNGLVDNMMKVVAQIKKATQEVSSATQEISAGNTHLSQRTEEHAASIEETASSMEEMTTTVKASADNAEQARRLAVTAREQADRGGAVLGAAVAAMTEINTASTKIADIIDVIEGIAFQTNLLALNAAVEAARAGEQGRGFAVVASEVRSLAGRSAAAAKEITSLITDSVSKVQQGSRLVDESGKVLVDISTEVKRVADVVSEIAQAGEQQAAGIEQVNKAVMQMDAMTQQNAALVEEAAASSQAIVHQVAELESLVARYQVDWGAAASCGVTAPRGKSVMHDVRGSVKSSAAA